MVTVREYVPDRGDVVWLTFNPQTGHEQFGRRPAVVLSPAAYNGKVGLGLFCPVTSQVKGYPFEVLVPPRLKITGAVLADQMRSLDWRARRAEFIGRLSPAALEEVLKKAGALLG
jgi:mRNA interferase MazF